MLSAESARTGIFAFRDAEGLSGEWHESGQTGRTDGADRRGGQIPPSLTGPATFCKSLARAKLAER